jgi:fumarylacetoacetase
MFVIPPDAKSWIDVPADSHFPIQNLPFCSVESQDGGGVGGIHLGVRIGDQVLSFNILEDLGFLEGSAVSSDSTSFFSIDTYLWGGFGLEELSNLRQKAYSLLRADSPALGEARNVGPALLPINSVCLLMPMAPRAFVDFYSGINHASNVGKMFRPDQPPLLPNYRHLPVGYNGRASSVVPSGTQIRRPKGQQKIGEEIVFGPTKELDFELEMGFFTAGGNEMGEPIPIGKAQEHILGVVLVNDWSARDMQRWEYVPLGPFLAKSFATSISPYVVTLDALEPFRIQGQSQDPEPFPHLRNPKPSHYDITLEVSLQTQRMTKPQMICRSNAKHLYWSFVQQLAHQTSNGTPIELGDLYASGTISGTEEDSYGSMLELCWKGTKPLTMHETGETRTWLQDGDTLILSGYCQGDGYRVGFGECRGTVLPALS